jgi:hypothetical protein
MSLITSEQDETLISKLQDLDHSKRRDKDQANIWQVSYSPSAEMKPHKTTNFVSTTPMTYEGVSKSFRTNRLE